MLFKVYAQNCVRPKGMRIIEASQDALNEVYSKLVDEAINSDAIDVFTDDELDDNKYSAAIDKCEIYFKVHKSISAGDYEIVNVKSIEDISIPNVCYSDASIIFDSRDD